MQRLVLDKVPKHIAFVMDGNGRWAKKRLLPRVAGHTFAVNRVRELVESCAQLGVQALTLFAFSSENWQRPEEEVSALMGLLLKALDNEVSKLHDNHVQVKVIGDVSVLSARLQESIRVAENLTQNNAGLKLRIALNYGGHWDIAQAAQKLASQVQSGCLTPEAITPERLAAELSTADLPNPDLFIRTSGEQRISNFMIWQLAYSELYFTDTLFPDFDAEALYKALVWFNDRERRFGKTSEQVRVKRA